MPDGPSAPDVPAVPDGPGVARLAMGPGGLRAAVAAFAAGHAAVLLAAPDADAALLGVAEAELGAPMTAVIGPGPGGTLAVLGTTELVPALLALDAARPDAAAEAFRLAGDAGLSLVVLPATSAPADVLPGAPA